MRAIARFCVLVFVTGCATGGKVAPPETPEPSEAACADCLPSDERPPDTMLPVDPMNPALPLNVEAECSQAARLSAVGEHKPAVDGLETVLRAGATCPDAVMTAVKDSGRRLADADELARVGLEARKVGDIATAKESFHLALVVYPKYYWVQKLVHDLPADSLPEVQALREAAAERLSSGLPEEALELLEQAALMSSAGPEVAEEMARIRTEVAIVRLSEARRAQQTGDLSRAAERTKEALAAQPDQPVLEQVVDFARRLGLHLFSTGELIKARNLWDAALSLDQGNALLGQYLEEVNARLRNLDAIKDPN